MAAIRPKQPSAAALKGAAGDLPHSPDICAFQAPGPHRSYGDIDVLFVLQVQKSAPFFVRRTAQTKLKTPTLVRSFTVGIPVFCREDYSPPEQWGTGNPFGAETTYKQNLLLNGSRAPGTKSLTTNCSVWLGVFTPNQRHQMVFE